MFVSTRRFIQAALIGSVVVALGCHGSVTDSESDLARARRNWTASGPHSYDITVGESCFCGFEAPGPVVVSVRNGTVESRHYVQTGAPVGAAFVYAYPTVDELFTVIDRAIAAKSERVDVQYDPVLGYPVTVAIDGALNVADDEYFYGVTAFVAR